MDCLITVVVPVYNSEKLLDRCVSSIVNQTYQSVEIVLVDDGSSDNSPAMCDEWTRKDSRIKTIHKKNAGAGIARNTGIENASGEYVCFVDSDDYLEHTALEECVCKLGDSFADVILFGSSKAYKDGTVRPEKLAPTREYFEGSQLTEELLPSLFVYGMGYGVNVWGRLYKLSVIRENDIRFRSEREIYSEDAFFNLEFFPRASCAIVIAKHLYYYYENDNSLSRRYSSDRQEKNDCFLAKAVEFVEQESLPSVLSWCIQARYHGCVMVALKQIILSELPRREKLKCLRAEYNNQILKGTLHPEVFAFETKSMALFFRMVKMRWYVVCDLLLWIRVNK